MADAAPAPTVNVAKPLAGRFALFRGHSLVIVTDEGRLEGEEAAYYFHKTRFLAELAFEIGGRAPKLASANPTDPARLLAYYLAPVPGGQERSARGDSPADVGEIGAHGIEAAVEIAAGRQALRLAVTVTNHGVEPCVLPLSWRASADFRDQAAGGAEEDDSASEARVDWADDVLTLASKHEKLKHATRLSFSGGQRFYAEGATVRCETHLASQESARIVIEVAPVFDPAFAHELPPSAVTDPEAWRGACARLETGFSQLGRAWERATDDIQALQLGDGEGEEGFVPAAGAPNYIGLFGRDVLMTALQTLALNPATARGALSLVGRWTADRYDPDRDAQPGRILHQRQLGPWALTGRTPYLHYWGDHSASGLFLLCLAQSFAHDGDAERFRSRRDLALRVLEWMDRDGDPDGDGLYEYRTLAGEKGLKNQGWKDSRDAILYPDGEVASDPLAVCEIQGLFYAAKRAMGACFSAAGEEGLGARLTNEAAALKARFDARFWMPDERFYALALDPDKRQIATIASNPGACLAYGVVPDEKARAVADRLMSPEMFSGWGVRTLSKAHPAFNPLAYHLGSVWPAANATTLRGLARYGFTEHHHALARALVEATELFEFDRLPELFGGHDRTLRPHPGLYPKACSPQAWSAGAVIATALSFIGLAPAAPCGVVFVDPKPPEWAAELTFRALPLGRGRLDLRLIRQGGRGCCEVLANSTGLRVVPLPEVASDDDKAALAYARACG